MKRKLREGPTEICTEFIWKNFTLTKIKVLGDGNCLFHALLLGFSIYYRNSLYNGLRIERLQVVNELRKELAKLLVKEYDNLSKGLMQKYSESVKEFSLEQMRKALETSGVPIGYGYLEHIANSLNKDIIVFDAKKSCVYKTDENELLWKDRNTIILNYSDGHYDLIGLTNDGVVDTYFSPEHELVQQLKLA